MALNDEMVWCDGCGVEITWGPIIVGERIHCCRDCAQNIPCRCGERLEIDDYSRSTTEAAPLETGYMS